MLSARLRVCGSALPRPSRSVSQRHGVGVRRLSGAVGHGRESPADSVHSGNALFQFSTVLVFSQRVIKTKTPPYFGVRGNGYTSSSSTVYNCIRLTR